MIETVIFEPNTCSRPLSHAEFCDKIMLDGCSVDALPLDVKRRGSGNPMVTLTGRGSIYTKESFVSEGGFCRLLVVDVPKSKGQVWFILNQAMSMCGLSGYPNNSMVHHLYMSVMAQLLFGCTQRVTPPGLTKHGRVKGKACLGLKAMAAHVEAALQVLRMFRYFESKPEHSSEWNEMTSAICARELTSDGATSDMMQHRLAFALSGVATPQAVLLRMMSVSNQRMMSNSGTVSRWWLMGMVLLGVLEEHCGHVRPDSSDETLASMAASIAASFMGKQKQAACRKTHLLVAVRERNAMASNRRGDFTGSFGVMALIGLHPDTLAGAGAASKCPVCWENLNRGKGTYLPCGHALCLGCAKELPKSNCPICRAEFDASVVLWPRIITSEYCRPCI